MRYVRLAEYILSHVFVNLKLILLNVELPLNQGLVLGSFDIKT